MKKTKNSSGKIRFGGLCKILVGLCFFLPAPALATPGGVMHYVGNKKVNAITVQFMEGMEGKTALVARESRLQTLRELRNHDAISLEEYNREVSYLNSENYINDSIKASSQAQEFEDAESLKITGDNLALIGGLVGVISTGAALYIGSAGSEYGYGNSVLNWFRHGGKELATGQPWYEKESEG